MTTPHSRDWAQLTADYLSHLRFGRNLSPNSIEAYGRDVEGLRSFLGEGVAPDEVQREHVEQFLAGLYEIGVEASTQARMLSGVRSFFQFLQAEGVINASPVEFVELPKLTRKLPDVLTTAEVDSLLEGIDLSHPQGHRNKAMLETLYSCGLRVSELISLRLSDLFFDDGFIRVTGKGDKQRLVPLSAEAERNIKLWLEQRRLTAPDPRSADIVFLNRNGRKLTRMMIFTIVRQAARNAGIDKSVSPHTFRHSFATHLLEGGASIRQVQELLGHESITTTEIYTHLDGTRLARTVDTHHPLARK